jgi:predicted nucleic acid-binding Zn ribbon protein
LNLHNGTSILDWNYYESKAKRMNEDQLRFSIQDCKAAMKAAPSEATFPCKGEGFYMDEMCVYSDELRRRQK